MPPKKKPAVETSSPPSGGGGTLLWDTMDPVSAAISIVDKKARNLEKRKVREGGRREGGREEGVWFTRAVQLNTLFLRDTIFATQIAFASSI